MRVLLVVSFFCLAGGLAQAEPRYMLGRELIVGFDAEARVTRGVSRRDDVADSYRVYGYISGVVDSMKNIGIFCVPKSVPLGQISAIVEKYVRANPESWGQGAEELVFQALHPVYPCPPK